MPFRRHMRLGAVLLLACAASALSSGGRAVAAAQGTAAVSHVWRGISYPPLPIPGAEHDRMHVSVSSGGPLGEVGSTAEPSHLRFDLQWSGVRSQMPKAIADAATIRLRLHTGDGKVFAPDRSATWIGVRGGGGDDGAEYFLTSTFPWCRNSLDEAWFEFHAGSEVYWVELPYGFARNPSDPERPEPTRGPPQFPPAMTTLGDHDVLVPWLHVDYDLGRIENGWRLSIELGNPFDAHAETILSRDDSRMGSSGLLGKIDSPNTGMEIQPPGGPKLVGREIEMGIRPDGGGIRRRDVYDFDRFIDDSPSDRRTWGIATIHVEDMSYSISIPSSLFMYVHGVTDPGNKKRLHAPWDPPWR